MLTMKNVALGMSIALASSVSHAVTLPAWQDETLSPDQRASALTQAMTLDEKIRRVHSEMAMPVFGISVPAGAIGSAGYVPEEKKYGIPAWQVTDASLGVANPANVRPGDGATALPAGLSSAASWDPVLNYKNGQLIGDEAWRKGFNVLLAGGINLARDPRNGRNFEYYGEDPLLAGIMVGQSIKGIQSQHVMSTIKHFAMNDQESARFGMSANISEPAMHESDLLAFQIAIEQGQPGAVMCGYNRVNGIYACENPDLLQKTLKDKWGYSGFVMSDWGAVHDTAAALTGLDIEMGSQVDNLLFGNVFFDKLLRDKAQTTEQYRVRLDDMNRRILRSMFDVGLFEHPPIKSLVDYESHKQQVRHAAEEGMVLLRNERNVLPLNHIPRHILVIGGHADAGVISGAGSAQVIPVGGPALSIHTGGGGMMAELRNQVYLKSSPLDALKKALPDSKITFNDGRNPAEAAALARDADVVIVFATQWMMESYDAYDLSLPEGQDALIDSVAHVNPHTVVVLETGGPVLMPWLDKTAAVLEAWYPGSAGGEAIARVLTGEVNPSGHLPITFPKSLQQLPRQEIAGFGTDAAKVDVDYNREGADVGYKWFTRQKESPLFPFGFGLSYTQFTYRDLRIEQHEPLVVSVAVTNAGRIAGKAVPQVYLTAVNGKQMARLLGWQKVALQPGELQRVSIQVDPRLLANYSVPDGGWKISSGNYRVAAGDSSAHLPLTQSVEIATKTFGDSPVSR
ncbi:beta-glucosidase [Klebsiella variicola]|uniref:beta-glucosidase family protein n=1 Tax=Klebsiella variicola TaxID=244366 RepID=UPI0034C674BD